MKMLRRIPQFLRFIPGTAQDVRAYFLTLQYWLAGSEENIANMVRYLVAATPPARAPLQSAKAKAAAHRLSRGGVYHPRLAARFSDRAGCRGRRRRAARSGCCCCARTCWPATAVTTTA
jgi:magnesium chelatase subunit H